MSILSRLLAILRPYSGSLMQPRVHSTPLVLRFVSITPESRYRLLLLSCTLPFSSQKKDLGRSRGRRDLAVYFVASPSTRRSLFVFPEPAIGSRTPLASRPRAGPASRPPARFLSSSPLPLFSSFTPHRSGLPVHRCHPSPSSSATSFVPRPLAHSSAAPVFLRSLALGFRSVGLWRRKNQRASERASL